MDGQGSSGSRSSAAKRLQVAQKRAELLAIKEWRAEAELEIIEAEEEAESRYSGQTEGMLVHRLAMVGLGDANGKEADRS